MTVTATSLKLPSGLKKRIARLAKQGGESPHALMVRALSEHADLAEQHTRFVLDGLDADAEMVRSGQGYAMEDVHRYLLDRAHGKTPRKPRPVRWRR